MRYFVNNDKEVCDVGETISEEEVFIFYNNLGLDVDYNGKEMTDEEILQDFIDNHDAEELSIQDIIRRRL
jgi:hypothetical protein